MAKDQQPDKKDGHQAVVENLLDAWCKVVNPVDSILLLAKGLAKQTDQLSIQSTPEMGENRSPFARLMWKAWDREESGFYLLFTTFPERTDASEMLRREAALAGGATIDFEVFALPDSKVGLVFRVCDVNDEDELRINVHPVLPWLKEEWEKGNGAIRDRTFSDNPQENNKAKQEAEAVLNQELADRLLGELPLAVWIVRARSITFSIAGCKRRFPRSVIR